MKYRTERTGTTSTPHTRPSTRKEPLSEARFQDLLLKAGTFFAEAERDVEGERTAVIAEILQTLDRYELTVEDLR